MKKVIAVLLVAMVMLAGCGSKAEPITIDEVTGYWYDETEEGIYQFTEAGMMIVYAPMKSGDEILSWFPLPVGTFSCGEEVKLLLAVGSETSECVCEFSDDKNSLTFATNGNTVNAVRISSEEAAAMGIEVK